MTACEVACEVEKRGVVGRLRVGVSTQRVLGGPMGVGNDAVEFEPGVRFLAAALFAKYSWGVKSPVSMGLPLRAFLAYGLTRALPKPAVRLPGVCPKPEDVDLEVRL